jgi:hypothetical protein
MVTDIALAEADVLRLRTTYKYERTMYWTGQLFTETFDTSPVHVVEELDEMEEEEKGGGSEQLAVKSED